MQTTVRHGRPSAKILILGDDAVAGRALGLLLQGGVGTVLYLSYNPDVDLASYRDVKLLVLAPELAAERREEILNIVAAMATETEVQALDLSTDGRTQRLGPWHRVLPWPSLVKEIGPQVEELLSQGRLDQAAEDEEGTSADPAPERRDQY